MNRQDKYTRSARGKPCQVRIPGVCNHDPETTVLAHLNGAGMGRKHYNIHGAYACSACHAWLDGGYVAATAPVIQNSKRDRDLYHLQAVIRTQIIMINEGVLEL